MRLLPSLLLSLSLVACSTATDPNTDQAAASSVPAGSDRTPGSSGSPAVGSDRDRWQKPEELITLMGGNLQGVTVADLFAEDGYFTFKMIAAGANVIAIVNDAGQAEQLNARKKELGLGDDRLRVRAVAVGDPGLAAEEADMALIVHHFTLLQDRKAFFKRMREGLRYPRILFMVEWQYKEGPPGPPMAQRLPIEKVMDMVGEMEYADVGAHSAKIPDQVIYAINDYFDAGMVPRDQ